MGASTRTEQLDDEDLFILDNHKCLGLILNYGFRHVGRWKYGIQIALLPFAWYDHV